jgi:putative Ig domain-containing protein
MRVGHRFREGGLPRPPWRGWNRALPVHGLILIVFAQHLASAAPTRVEDVFGRSLDERGVALVDWDGYMANPLIKFYILPPTNAALPGSARLTANGARLYFDNPGSVSANGPVKTVSLSSPASRVPIRLSIFPDRDSVDEEYTLTIVFTGANNAKETNMLPIRVRDLDVQRTNAFVVTMNFDRDITEFFTNSLSRALTMQAAEDWAYFFADMNLDPVPVGSETTYIWSNNFNGGYYFANTNAYRGYLLYAYGTTNATHRSGGDGSYSGPVQRSGGVPLTIKRSGGFEAEIYGNYNTLGWLRLTNDNDWLVTGNLGNETNDFYSIAHHEIGHALMFNRAHPGFAAASDRGGFTNAVVTNYYGGPVAIDAFDHMNGAIDPESGQGAFGYEYYGSIPRKRWIITKLDLLCAQAVGYTLRPNAALALVIFPNNAPPSGLATVVYAHSFTATGGIPFYHWEIVAGALPPGLVLDSFTGALTGTPATNGVFAFTIRVRDYRETGGGLTRDFNLNIAPAPPVRLAISIVGQDPDQQAEVFLTGATGQRQVIEASTDLVQWTSIATNSSATNLFRAIAGSLRQFNQRFYRASVMQP